MPRSGALAGWLASVDALYSVDLVGEWRPASARPARAPYVAAARELAVLGGLCPPAAGR